MHSAKPLDDSYINEPSLEQHRDDTWRAEVAARVSSYRCKHKKNQPDAPSLDFGPNQESAASNRVSRQLATPKPQVPAARSAFDTNYYRRLNAEAMAQPQGMLSGAAVRATVPEPEALAEPEVAPGTTSELRDDSVDTALDLELRPDAGADSILDRYCISEPAPGPEPELPEEPPTAEVIPQQPERQPQGNLIVFPRPLLEPPLAPLPSRDELAEPMSSRPRILEVPEDIMPAMQGSLFPEIRLDGDEQETSSNAEPKIAVPLQVAPISTRLLAALTDLGVVLAGGLLFAVIALHALPDIPHTKPFWMGLGVMVPLLWAIYEHLFLLYAGKTLGMSMRGIHLRTFEGQVPEWKQRSLRARFMFVSGASVALGFLWALVDEDELCWHDRISHTFPTTE